MLVKYNPEIQGRELTNEEKERLIKLKPDFSSFSIDEPELTDELIRRMKQAKTTTGKIGDKVAFYG